MAYEKTVWVNGQAPALDADHLNKIEQGIADAVSITPQTLTNEQQAQARGNINAASDDYVNSNKQNGVAALGKVERRGWYRVVNGNVYASGILSLNHVYYTGGPTSLNFLVTMNTDIPEIKCIDYPISPIGYVMPIENVRFVKGTDVYDLHIDVFYKLVGPNDLFINFMNMGQRPASVQAPVFVAENDVLPEGETLIATMEFQNPPMLLGVEYRTTERYLGKPVYTQVFKAFDSLAKGGQVYDAPILNTSQVISCTGESGNWNLPSDVVGGEVAGDFIRIGTQRDSTVVHVYAITNRETWSAPVYVTLKYTKTTD